MSDIDYYEKYQALQRDYAEMKKQLTKLSDEQRKQQVQSRYQAEKLKRDQTRGVGYINEPGLTSAAAAVPSQRIKEQDELIKAMETERAQLQTELRKARQAERLAHIGATHVGNVRPPTSTIPKASASRTTKPARPQSAGIQSRGIRVNPSAASSALPTESTAIYPTSMPNASYSYPDSGTPLGDHRALVQSLLNRIEEHLPAPSSSTTNPSPSEDTTDNPIATSKPLSYRAVSLAPIPHSESTSQDLEQGGVASVSEVIALRKDLRESKAKIALLQSHFDNLQLSFQAEKEVQTYSLKQNEDLKALLQESRRTCMELQRQVQRYELDQDQLEAYKQMVNDYKIDAEAMRAELTALKDERMAFVAADKAELRRLKVDQTERDAQSKATIEHLTAENDRLKQEVKVRIEQLAVRSHDLEEAKKRLQSAEDQLANVASQLAGAQQKLALVTASTGIEPSEMSEALEIVRRKRRADSDGILSRGINLGGVAGSSGPAGGAEEDTVPSLQKKLSVLEAKLRDALADQKSERMLRSSVERMLSEAKDQIKTLTTRLAETSRADIVPAAPQTQPAPATRGIALPGAGTQLASKPDVTSNPSSLEQSTRQELDSLFELDPTSESDIDAFSSAVADRSAQNSQPANNVFAFRVTEARLSPRLFPSECLTFLSVAALGLGPDVSAPVGGREPRYDFVMQATLPSVALARALEIQSVEIALHLHKGGAASQKIATAKVPLRSLLVTSPSTTYPLYAPEVSERIHGNVDLILTDGSNATCGHIVYDTRLLYPAYAPGALSTLSNTANPVPKSAVTVPAGVEARKPTAPEQKLDTPAAPTVNCADLVEFVSAIVPPSKAYTRLAASLRIREVITHLPGMSKIQGLRVSAQLPSQVFAQKGSKDPGVIQCATLEEYASALQKSGLKVTGLEQSRNSGDVFVAMFELEPGTQLTQSDEITFTLYDGTGRCLGTFNFPFVVYLTGGLTGHVKNLYANAKDVQFTYDAAVAFVPSLV